MTAISPPSRLPRAAISVLMAAVFGALAAPPLIALIEDVGTEPFRPESFPAEWVAFTVIALLTTAAAWLFASRDPGVVPTLVVALGSCFGLLVGAYGLFGTSSLLSDCRYVQTAVASLASLPEGYCHSDAYRHSLAIGGYLIAVGIASLISLLAIWLLSRKPPNPAVD